MSSLLYGLSDVRVLTIAKSLEVLECRLVLETDVAVRAPDAGDSQLGVLAHQQLLNTLANDSKGLFPQLAGLEHLGGAALDEISEGLDTGPLDQQGDAIG